MRRWEEDFDCDVQDNKVKDSPELREAYRLGYLAAAQRCSDDCNEYAQDADR